jgi:hypothetical protein
MNCILIFDIYNIFSLCDFRTPAYDTRDPLKWADTNLIVSSITLALVNSKKS